MCSTLRAVVVEACFTVFLPYLLMGEELGSATDRRRFTDFPALYAYAFLFFF